MFLRFLLWILITTVYSTSLTTPRYTFVKVRHLGEGYFGHVDEVVDSNDPTVRFARKKISKNRLERALVGNWRNEIHLHHSVGEHPNIVPFRMWYEDADYVYILTDVCTGGTLLQLLEKRGELDESTSMWYAWDIANGIKHLHDNNVVHRDLKLDNILLDGGFMDAKICDFGLAKRLDRSKKYYVTHVIGAIGFIAPEMKVGHRYSFSLDIWAFGVMCYRMLVGNTPLVFVNNVIQFPTESAVSPSAMDLLTRMLTVDPILRLNIDQVIAHVWFDEVRLQRMDWVEHSKSNPTIRGDIILSKISVLSVDSELSSNAASVVNSCIRENEVECGAACTQAGCYIS